MTWLSRERLEGFKRVGKDVKISDQATIFGAKHISIGDNVRIDAGTIILAAKGVLEIGSHIHVAAQCLFVCGGGIHLGDYTAISFGCKLISASDDFSGDHLIGPTLPDEYRQVTQRPIRLEALCALGSSCVVMPGVTMKEGSVAGACSFVNSNLDPWSIYFGVPAKKIRQRSQTAKELASDYRARLVSSLRL